MPKRQKKYGECRECGNPSGEYFCCEPCRKRLTLYAKRNREKKMASGLCQKCGKLPFRSGLLTCDNCQKKNSIYSKRVRSKWIKACRCRSCGKIPTPNTTRCETCFFKQVACNHFGNIDRWREIRELFYKQDRKCSYTNIELKLNGDTSLDHILPKNLGGDNNIDNLQWVHIVVNRMKRDYKDSVFLFFVKEIFRHSLENKKYKIKY